MADATGNETPSLPDDDELAAARAEDAAESKGEGGESDQQQPDQTTQEPPAEPAATDKGAKPEPAVMIPKARFDEVARRAAEAAAQAAYWKGRADALAGGKSGDAGAPTPGQQIEELEAKVDAEAARFDAGEISLADFRRFEREVNRQIADLRRPAGREEPGQVADMRLDELTAALPQRFPVLGQIDGDAYLSLQPAAQAQLAREGVRLVAGEPRSTYIVRERMAEIATKLYGTTTKPSTGTDPQESARRKLALATRAPPDIATAASGKRGDPGSEEALDAMDADDYAALPDSTRAARLARLGAH